jgi:predicted HNH restriction endonuclease
MEKVFTPYDIKWIKNVNNDKDGHAYIRSDETYILNFPDHHSGENLQSPQVGDIILLWQKINGKRVFTHLVTPTDDQRTDSRDGPNFKYGRNIKVLAYTGIDDAIPTSFSSLWQKVKFQGISQGNACRIANIKSIIEQNIFDSIICEIWDIFRPFFKDILNDSNAILSNISVEVADSDNPPNVIEGGNRVVTHIVKERNRAIVQEKKNNAQNGTLKCEVCGFCFFDKFKVDFIECHHIVPISQSGETITSLDDLALVCPNCHRMLHRKFDEKYLTVEELRNKFYN